MQLALSAEDAEFRDEMREFFTTKVPQEIRDAVGSGASSARTTFVQSMQILNDAGLAVPNWPVEWGGQDWTPLRRHIWHEEMQRAYVPTPLAFNASMIGPVIAQFGSQEMKERFLPKTANLDIWWSQGFSEPDAGSDLASLRTSAVRDGDEYVVNGQKTWTTLGQYGDWIFTLVRTDPDVKKQAGISLLLIDMTSQGVDVRPIELIDGGHEVNEVWFDNVRVPVENLVGEENRAWDYAKFLLGNERVGVAPVGATKRVARRRPRSGPARSRSATTDAARRPAGLDPDRRARERAARPRAHRAARGGQLRRRQAAPGLVGAQAQGHRAAAGGDRAGRRPRRPGLGWPAAPATAPTCPGGPRTPMPVYLNFRKASIYGGSNEVQRQIIARTILGL